MIVTNIVNGPKGIVISYCPQEGAKEETYLIDFQHTSYQILSEYLNEYFDGKNKIHRRTALILKNIIKSKMETNLK